MVLGQEDMGEGSRETASPGKGQFCLMEGGPHGLDSGRWRSSRGGGILGSLEVGQGWRPHEAPCTDLPPAMVQGRRCQLQTLCGCVRTGALEGKTAFSKWISRAVFRAHGPANRVLGEVGQTPEYKCRAKPRGDAPGSPAPAAVPPTPLSCCVHVGHLVLPAARTDVL